MENESGPMSKKSKSEPLEHCLKRYGRRNREGKSAMIDELPGTLRTNRRSALSCIIPARATSVSRMRCPNSRRISNCCPAKVPPGPATPASPKSPCPFCRRGCCTAAWSVRVAIIDVDEHRHRLLCRCRFHNTYNLHRSFYAAPRLSAPADQGAINFHVA